MTTLDRFAEGLKARLRKKGSSQLAGIEGSDICGEWAEINWDELDRAIDEFCAEFKARK